MNGLMVTLCLLSVFYATTDAKSTFAVCVVTEKALVNFNGELKLHELGGNKHTIARDCTASEFSVEKHGDIVDIDHNDYMYQLTPTGVKVDGKVQNIPVGGHITAGTVEIFHEPNNAYRLKFHRGGSVVYREGKVIVNVNPHFKNRLCGICGNFGDNASSVRSIVKFD